MINVIEVENLTKTYRLPKAKDGIFNIFLANITTSGRLTPWQASAKIKL